MKIIERLVDHVHRAFRKDPDRVLALRIRYDGTMKWQVDDAVLTLTVSGGTGANQIIDLTAYTIAELAGFIDSLPGYSVPFVQSGDTAITGARALLEGTGTQEASNGDHLYAFQSLEYAFMASMAVELRAIRTQISEALRQLSTVTAENEWLDEIGGYYAVERNVGELDEDYGPRIVYEVVRPRNNNKAIEIAAAYVSGSNLWRVTDVEKNENAYPYYNGEVNYDGEYKYQLTDRIIRNLFSIAYDAPDAGDARLQRRVTAVMEVIDQFRAAGNHLEKVILQMPSTVDVGIVGYTSVGSDLELATGDLDEMFEAANKLHKIVNVDWPNTFASYDGS